MCNLFLIRHGTTYFNEQNIITGTLDVPLSNAGYRECCQLSHSFNYKLDVIYTSTLLRSIETAIYLLKDTCAEYDQIPLTVPITSSLNFKRKNVLPIIKTELLNERNYGFLQGVSRQDITKTYSQSEINAWYTTMNHAPPDGESLQQVKKRTDAFYENYLKKHLRAAENLAIIAHQNTLKTLLLSIDSKCDFIKTGYKIKNCEIIHYKL